MPDWIERAVELAGEGRMSISKIASEVGVTRQRLYQVIARDARLAAAWRARNARVQRYRKSVVRRYIDALRVPGTTPASAGRTAGHSQTTIENWAMTFDELHADMLDALARVQTRRSLWMPKFLEAYRGGASWEEAAAEVGVGKRYTLDLRRIERSNPEVQEFFREVDKIKYARLRRDMDVVVENMRAGMTVEDACEAAGVPRGRTTSWLISARNSKSPSKAHVEFLDEYTSILEERS